MKFVIRILISFVVTCLGLLSKAMADYPRDWQINLQEAATPLMEKLQNFHHGLVYMEFGISIFVMLLLAYVIIKFRASKNKVPSKTTHNTMIEVVWTIVPVVILVIIAIPSLRVLSLAEKIPQTDMTLKVVGYQWYWHYIYPDNGNISFDSNLVQDKDLKPSQKRLLSVDNPVVLPVDTNIRLQTTAADVIHSWAVPSFAVKKDAIPGRLNEAWFRIEKVGTYYGQCSELCGQGHGYMPIEVRAVSKEDFKKWVESKQQGNLAKNNTK